MWTINPFTVWVCSDANHAMVVYQNQPEAPAIVWYEQGIGCCLFTRKRWISEYLQGQALGPKTGRTDVVRLGFVDIFDVDLETMLDQLAEVPNCTVESSTLKKN